jgi:hypothetical protein
VRLGGPVDVVGFASHTAVVLLVPDGDFVGLLVVVVVLVLLAAVVVVVEPVEPPVMVAVSTVSTPVLVHVMGMWVVPRVMVRFKGLAVVNCGSVTLRVPLEPAAMVPLCVAVMTTAALGGYVAGTVKPPLTASDGVPDPFPTVRGTDPENATEFPGVVNGSRVLGNWRTTPSPVSGPFNKLTPAGFVDAL